MMRLDEGKAGITRRQLVRALAAEGAECYEGYCRPLYLQPLYQQDWARAAGRTYGPGLCPVAERMYEREVLFHTALWEQLRTPFVDQICTAFEKVWENREALRSVSDDGTRAIRRA
jgi:dTDP-4-amino-4,6-dideoxygalactose transaminase